MKIEDEAEWEELQKQLNKYSGFELYSTVILYSLFMVAIGIAIGWIIWGMK